MSWWHEIGSEWRLSDDTGGVQLMFVWVASQMPLGMKGEEAICNNKSAIFVLPSQFGILRQMRVDSYFSLHEHIK